MRLDGFLAIAGSPLPEIHLLALNLIGHWRESSPQSGSYAEGSPSPGADRALRVRHAGGGTPSGRAQDPSPGTAFPSPADASPSFRRAGNTGRDQTEALAQRHRGGV